MIFVRTIYIILIFDLAGVEAAELVAAPILSAARNARMPLSPSLVCRMILNAVIDPMVAFVRTI
jgi:hypothetical protein